MLSNVAFRHVAAAHVLVDEDVAFLGEMLVGAEGEAMLVVFVGTDAVGRAHHEDGVFLRLSLGE